MKKLQLLCLVILYTIFSTSAFANLLRDIQGKVIDANNNKALPGATVYIPDLKITAITNENGEFNLKNLPTKGTYLIEVHYLGYKTSTKVVNLSSNSNVQFSLEETAIETKEIVITGSVISSTSKRNSASAEVVGKDKLLTPSNNLIDALSRVPGLTQITTGPAISKPVIRGLGFNRIVTLDGGIKQQGQQWGEEHGIEIDQFKADKIEVLRGAASLMYGSDALGGVINILEPATAPEGTTTGEFSSNYSTNNGLIGNSLMLNGNENGFVWRVRGSYKNAHSYKTPTAYLPNSGYNETNLSGMIGLNKSWGYSHLNVSNFNNNVGFYEAHLDAFGNLVGHEGEEYTINDFKSRTVGYPSQDIRHLKVALNNNIILKHGSLKANLGYQQNQRRELHESQDPSLFFDLKTYNADLKYSINESNGWQPVFGLSAESGNSVNKSTQEYLIPEYKTLGLGAFGFVKKNWAKTTISLGARYDFKKNNGKRLVDVHHHDDHEEEEEGHEEHEDHEEIIFPGFANKFSNLSGAFGFTHQLNEFFNIKANAGSAFRAPNPAELGSNGVHHGAFRYEIGSGNLSPERSYQVDAALEFENKYLSASVSIFNNYINDFIYASNNGETIEVEDHHQHGDHSHTVLDTYPVFRYGQVNANLYGAEASLTLHPVNFIHFENTFSYVNAQNRTLNRPLAFTPAASLRNEIKFEPNIKGTNDAYLLVGITTALRQDRFDQVFETATSGYTLLNLGIGATFKIGKQSFKLSAAANNLLDKKYYDALSRYKPGRFSQSNPTLGMYNMGRNITFGLHIPFNLVK